MRRALALLCLSGLAASCGSSPAGPKTASVSGVVFYDENGNGRLDGGEAVRLPGVAVMVGPRTFTSGEGGRLDLADVPTGAMAMVQASTLPPFYVPGSPVTIASGGTLAVPVTLPIGDNQPNVYLGFGDSITSGEGSRAEHGYLDPLAAQLIGGLGRATMVNDGINGTRSDQGASRLAGSLARFHPAYVLIDYGTNDYDQACRRDGHCVTMASLQQIVAQARSAHSLPVLATLLPNNPRAIDPFALARDAWVERTNDQIRGLARAEGVPLADAWAAFVAQPDTGGLFDDFLHPDDRGYDLMADAFYDAITKPSGP